MLKAASRKRRWQIAAAVGLALVILASLYFGWPIAIFSWRGLPAAIPHAEKVVLYEGLTHQLFERKLLAEEQRTKSVQDLHGSAFYAEPLELSEDAARVTQILSDTSIYKAVVAHKKCGGYHPDYALEWHCPDGVYQAHLCFGCWEVKLYGPWSYGHFDLDRAAQEELHRLLTPYRKNRPEFRPGP